MKNEKGITLTSLVTMVVIILILTSIATYSGVGTIRNVKFNKARSEIQIIQANVNKWKEEYLNGNNDVLNYGVDLDNISSDLLQKVNDTFSNVEITDQTIKDNYKFFSGEYLKNNLSLDASFDYLVDIMNRDVILVGGVRYNSRIYYRLKNFGIINVEENLPNSISFNLDQGENTDIIISDLKLVDSNAKKSDISKFIVEYKKSDDTNWVDVTSGIIKFNDEEDENKTKFKFFVPEITDESVLNIEYNVKISTLDKNIEYSQNIKVESNNYVNSGLILHLDGINNTGSGHSDTTTTWKDLSGSGEDAVLNNIATISTSDSGWGDNYLAFDGINDFVSATRTSSGDFTIEILAKNIEVINDREYGSLFMINTWSSTATTTSIQLFKDLREESKRFQYRILVPATENDTYRETSHFNDFDNDNGLYVISKDDSKVNIYLDGNKVYEFSDNAFINRINVIAMNVEIGRWYNSIAPTKQRVYSFRIYNKALTDEEIKHNYRIDEYRFGL